MQFIGGNSAAATSLTIPSGHQGGDLLIMFGFRSGSTTPPTVPSGWTSQASNGANTCSAVLAFKIAASNSEVSGTWTNATDLVCLVYRSPNVTNPMGTPVNGNGSSTTISYPALTLAQAGGRSVIVGFAGHRTATNVNQAPTNMALRSNITVAAGSDILPTANNWPATNVSVNANSGWESYTVELFAAPIMFNNYESPAALSGNPGIISIGGKVR